MYAEELYYDLVYYLYFPRKEPRRKNLLGGTNKTNSIFFPFVTFYHFLFNVPIQKCILLSFLFTVFSKKYSAEGIIIIMIELLFLVPVHFIFSTKKFQ